MEKTKQYINIESMWKEATTTLDKLPVAAKIKDAYAMWAIDNLSSLKNNSGFPINKPFHKWNQVIDFKRFIHSHVSDTELAESIRRKVLDIAIEHPEYIKNNAEFYAKTFPNVVKNKIKYDQNKTKKLGENVSKILDKLDEDNNQPYKDKINLGEEVEAICAFIERGAKEIESPSGWKVRS